MPADAAPATNRPDCTHSDSGTMDDPRSPRHRQDPVPGASTPAAPNPKPSYHRLRVQDDDSWIVAPRFNSPLKCLSPRTRGQQALPKTRRSTTGAVPEMYEVHPATIEPWSPRPAHLLKSPRTIRRQQQHRQLQERRDKRDQEHCVDQVRREVITGRQRLQKLPLNQL